MRNYLLYALLLLATLGTTACGDDDDGNGADDAGIVGDKLQLDRGIQSGPILDAGYQELAVRFSRTQAGRFNGRFLEDVVFYLGQKPARTYVIVYGEGPDENTPGAELYVEEVTTDINDPRTTVPGWQTHNLLRNVTITEQEIWLAIGVSHIASQQSVGCDAGPAVNGGDFLLPPDPDNFWTTFRDRTNGSESVNWNIRGKVSDQ